MRDTPILTFVNKLDREGRDAMEILDEIEGVLGISCAPVTWPIGMGRRFKGVYDLRSGITHLFSATHKGRILEGEVVEGLDNPRLDELIGDQADELRGEIELVVGASHALNLEAYRSGELTPVFFGSAINNFGVEELLKAFVHYAPAPGPARLANVWLFPRKKNFPGSCLRSRPIWIPLTGIGSPFCGFVVVLIKKA